MTYPGKIGWLGVLISWLVLSISELSAQTAQTAPTATESSTPPRLAVDELPAAVRGKVRAVLDKATLSIRGPAEVFPCQPAVYYWLLDNPDMGVQLWRLMGAKCTDIDREPNDRFCWHDGQGSKLHWNTILRTTKQRIWYAEGRINPGLALLPNFDVQAVAVVNYVEGVDANGRPVIRHQIDLYVKTEGRVISVATKLFGASSPRMVEQYIGQMEMFFSALAWYLDQHPKKAEELFAELRRP